MSIVSLQGVQVAFGAEDVLLGVTGEIEQGDRIGLVGRNGAGKTTLLHVLTGELTPDQGRRHLARGTSIGMVEQLPREAESDRIVLEEATTVLAPLIEMEREVEAAAHAMAYGGEGAEARYIELQHRFEHAGGYGYHNRLSQVLNGLGLPQSEWSRPVSQLSGGQRSRLALAKALLSHPDLLILDEPTNHIDIEAMRWLDDFLARWPGTLLVTSHDRYFLDRVATRIWSLEAGRLKAYRGNYTQYEKLREDELVLQEKQATAQQEYIAKEEAFIRRYGAGQRAREAKGRAKKLTHIQRIEAPRSEKTASFKLTAQRSGSVALATKDLAVGYGTTTLLTAGTLEAERGERIALIGPNGSGKTTLLKTLSGELTPLAGTSRLGANVSVAHYWQEAENLDASRTVLEEVRRDRSMDPQIARDLLARFLFTGEDVAKQVSALSGGERSRLALAKLMLEGANLLLLDEPTNHLDIPARKSLEAALDSYPGTIIFVSHDRRLIADLATRLWLIEDGRVAAFDGTYAEYLERSATPVTLPAPKPAAVSSAPKPQAKLNRRTEMAIENIETEISHLERDLAELSDEINAASGRQDHVAVGELGRRFEDLKAELERLMDEWAVLTG